MAKIVLSNISTLERLSKINENFQKIEDVINDNLLSREPGSDPNFMKVDLDLNGKKLMNLPKMVDLTDAVRKGDMIGYLEDDYVTYLKEEHGLGDGYNPSIWNAKQDVLVSGGNIKTINGQPILGSGNLVVVGSGSGTTDHSLLTNRDVADQHPIASVTGLQTALDSKAASNHNHTIGDVVNLQTTLDGKQATLVSGVSIKTINGVSVLGSGDMIISGGGGGTTDHSALTNRGIADQHPISAITGLSAYTTKVDGIAAGATANSSDATLLSRANHTGTQAISTIVNLQTTLDGKASTSVATTGANGLMSSTDKAKLDGVATGATANSSDATLLARANHTGTQAISTVSGLQTALDAKQATITVGTTAPASPVTNQLWLDTN